MPENRPLPVTLLEWRPLRRNSLHGFAKVKLGALVMNELTVHSSSGRKWVGLPAKPILSADGVVQKDQRGKARYAPLLEWDNRDTAERFSESVVAAIEAAYPGATEEG